VDNKTKEHYKEILMNMKGEAEQLVQQMKARESVNEDGTTSYILSDHELSSYDNHPADLGDQLFLLTQHNTLMVHEEYRLRQINEALERLRLGTYGQCTFCGKEIGAERLEALPYAGLCIDCENSRTVDEEYLDRDRPAEELVWDAPFGRKYLNKREDDEYEGLDYLNDVMKYGSSDSPQDMGGYHDYEDFYTNDIDKQGIVDDMDRISNEQYKKQLPD
jgi:RNA polymerase-binding transcription factor DksA